jgi:hypothetical protein
MCLARGRRRRGTERGSSFGERVEVEVGGGMLWLYTEVIVATVKT